MYSKAVDEPMFQQLMEVHSHHADISVLITAQNTYQKGRGSVSILRNYSDFVLFDTKNQRHALEIFGRQMFPGQKAYLSKARDWLRRHISIPGQRYLWIDAHPASRAPENLRVRSRIVPEEEDYQLVFMYEE